MKKRAIIEVLLVNESVEVPNEQLEREILNELSGTIIPWFKEVEKVTIEEVEDNYKKLRGHGFPKKIARNIMRFYEG